MERATQRFFDIPELVAILTTYLNRKEISRLMQTNRQLHQICTPHTTTACLLTATHHETTTLTLKTRYPPQSTRSSARSMISPLKEQPDNSNIVSSPSRNHLGLRRQARTNVSAKDPKASVTYICWILHLNSHLIHVTISGLAFKNVRELRLVATSITCLGKLQELSLGAIVYKSPTFARVGPTIFYSCPPSLRSLSLELQEDHISRWSSYYTEEYCRLEPGELLSWERRDEECRLTTTPRRQGPLQYLKSLNLNEVEEFIPEAELISILQHCPNLLDFGMPDIRETQDAQQLAAAIVESCPALNELTYRDYCKDPVDGEMILRIVNLLSPQQFRRLRCNETPFTIPGLDAASLFRRHSITLQILTLGGCHNVNSKAIRTLLVECQGLQVLKIRWSGERHALCIDLEDAIEFPWRYEPLYRHLGVEPYYIRPPLTALSAAEKSQFEQLEKLYRQVGTLAQVEYLCLGVAFYNLKGSPPLSKDVRLNTFPAMLSLGDERTGRPGYLHHLAGLAKLRIFNGSVSAATDETKMVRSFSVIE
ncbi:hypothetical protein K457DRAFT_36316 [Linnemannia elongata AG-77]|uniref:RNI-like protein n=1 Tax=Linnemannia elongata AG-77 TaxID=1314771 RepID=A0A197JGZ0_9FUNG|nr:hypothetical protein K457DRAFT_36316 [Linnemannia elongata AG-77]